jgi:glutamate 5-kinase
MKSVSGTVVARGIANYSSSEMDRIKGLKSLDIEKELDINTRKKWSTGTTWW